MTICKLAAAWISGSVGVLSEGVHSFLDVVSAALSFFTVREAGKPADEDHPFGHGKIETLSSLFEALLLVIAAILIILEGVEHVIHPHPVEHQGLAIAVILVSIVVSFFVFKHNAEAARVTESSAIHVNALHFLSDVVASAGVLVGLVILRFTGLLVVDAIVAFLVAAYILVVSVQQVLHAIFELSDKQLPETEVKRIRDILESFRDKMIEAHDLRTRKSGAIRHIDFHLVTCGHMTVGESHSVCDEMEAEIVRAFPGASVNIHVEPCEQERTGCHTSCPKYQETCAIPQRSK